MQFSTGCHSVESSPLQMQHRKTPGICKDLTELITVSKQVGQSSAFSSQASTLHHCYLAGAAEGQAVSQLPSHQKRTEPLMDTTNKGQQQSSRKSHQSVDFLYPRACWEGSTTLSSAKPPYSTLLGINLTAVNGRRLAEGNKGAPLPTCGLTTRRFPCSPPCTFQQVVHKAESLPAQ